jgi:hypothetical protein
MSILQKSSHQSFKVKKLYPSVAICETRIGDLFDWGNAIDDEPAFIAYLGCRSEDVAGYVKTLNTFYRCSKCKVRQPKHLKNFEAEIKIVGMQRYCDRYAFGLDYLVESEIDKHFEINFDSYNYYTTGCLPRW